MTRALVRRPSPRMARGLITHIERRPPDVDLAMRQWDGYVAALESVGWQVIEVPSAPEYPDAVFVEDTMVVWREQAVIANPGADERAGEVVAAEATIANLGFVISHIAPPATLDGGDVLKIGDRFYVGVGGRTTRSGAQQLGALLGVEVIAVPTTKALHLKSAVTALPDGTAIGYPPIVDDPAVFDSFLPVPEEPGSHVVVIDESTVLMAASAPASRALLEARGLRVVVADISEFEKLEGCVTCLSVRLRAGG
ncbi:MAG: dimethylargininase [Actinomycetes bacterium]